MKSLQELYEEVKASDELKKALAAAVKAGRVTEFLKANGCDATLDELKEFVAEKVKSDKTLEEFNEEQLGLVAGGVSAQYCSEFRCSDDCPNC